VSCTRNGSELYQRDPIGVTRRLVFVACTIGVLWVLGVLIWNQKPSQSLATPASSLPSEHSPWQPRRIRKNPSTHEPPSSASLKDPIVRSPPRGDSPSPHPSSSVTHLPLITGCGRCGTLSVADALQKCGYNVLHEKVGRQGSVSWFYAVDDSANYAIGEESYRYFWGGRVRGWVGGVCIYEK
jgi:hypothetical protein